MHIPLELADVLQKEGPDSDIELVFWKLGACAAPRGREDEGFEGSILALRGFDLLSRVVTRKR